MIAIMSQYPNIYRDLSTIAWVLPRRAFYAKPSIDKRFLGMVQEVSTAPCAETFNLRGPLLPLPVTATIPSAMRLRPR